MQEVICTAPTNNTLESCVTAQVNRSWKPWRVSDEGLSFIAEWESGVLNGVNFLGYTVTDGFVLKAYLDEVGIPTVGCGHRILPDDEIQIGQEISLDRARAFKRHDVSVAERRINADVRVPLFQYEYDALVSVVYNCGSGSGASALINKVNAGDYSLFHDFLLTYRVGHSRGLRVRRASEARLFASGIYNASH